VLFVHLRPDREDRLRAALDVVVESLPVEPKSELEDIALSYLEPAEYEHIHRKLEETERERQTFIDRFSGADRRAARPAGIQLPRQEPHEVDLLDLERRCHKQHVPFEGVYDIFALRIILDCPPEEEKTQCWAVYSIVTDYYIAVFVRLLRG